MKKESLYELMPMLVGVSIAIAGAGFSLDWVVVVGIILLAGCLVPFKRDLY